MNRREYKTQLIVNGVFCNRVVIDTHYEAKHGDTICDELILELVKTLPYEKQECEVICPPFSYFMNDQIEYRSKRYKLIWLMEEHMDYIGVINAYRR